MLALLLHIAVAAVSNSDASFVYQGWNCCCKQVCCDCAESPCVMKKCNLRFSSI